MAGTLVFPDMMADIKVPLAQALIVSHVIQQLRDTGPYTPCLELAGFTDWCKKDGPIIYFDRKDPNYGDYLQGLGLVYDDDLLVECCQHLHETFVRAVDNNYNSQSVRKNLVSVTTPNGVISLSIVPRDWVIFSISVPAMSEKIDNRIHINVKAAQMWLKEHGYEC